MMQKVKPLRKLRFIWFGGEELGLLGSSYHVNNLTPTELSHIGSDLDADVTATLNCLIGSSTRPARTCSAGPSSTMFPGNAGSLASGVLTGS